MVLLGQALKWTVSLTPSVVTVLHISRLSSEWGEPMVSSLCEIEWTYNHNWHVTMYKIVI